LTCFGQSAKNNPANQPFNSKNRLNCSHIGKIEGRRIPINHKQSGTPIIHHLMAILPVNYLQPK